MMVADSARRERISGKGKVIEAARQFGDRLSVNVPMWEAADYDNEHAACGAILLQPDLFPALANVLQAGDFFGLADGFIWHAFEELSARNLPIDFRTVADFLDGEGKFEYKGEELVLLLTKTASACPNPDHAEYYAGKIREAALRARVLASCYEIIRETQDRGISVDLLVHNCNAKMFRATEQYFEKPTSARELASQFYDHVESVKGGKSGIVLSGFSALDALIGFYPGEVTVFAGAAGMGKTTVILSMLRNMVMKGKHAALFTLEMQANTDVMRALTAMHTGIAKRGLKHGDLTAAQNATFTNAIGDMSRWPLHIIDEFPGLTPTQLRRKLMYLMSREPIELVAVDGLWIMQPDQRNKDNRPADVASIMRALNSIAVDLHVPILITHQYRRDLDKEPGLGDLAESAGVERNAQVVMGMWRDGYRFNEVSIPTAAIHILKDRNGDATGHKVSMYYDGFGYRGV